MSARNRPLDKARYDANMAKLPEKAYVTNTIHASGPNGNPPILCVKKGQEGYWPIYTLKTAQELNQIIGATEAQAAAILHGSLFGFDTPGADPDCHIHQKGPL
jgi:hypothetical protein